MTRAHSIAALVLALGALVACGGSDTMVDAGGTDAGGTDAPAATDMSTPVDAPTGTDAGGDAMSAIDSGPVDSGPPVDGGLCGASTDPCGTCLHTMCCSELMACVADTTCMTYVGCASACAAGDATCRAACMSAAGSSATTAAFAGCVTSHCASDCL